jgi:hypothetical protein
VIVEDFDNSKIIRRRRRYDGKGDGSPFMLLDIKGLVLQNV